MGVRRELLDHKGHVLSVFHYDEARPEEFIIETRENNEAIKEHIGKLRQYRESREGRLHEMRHLAEIPNTVLDRAHREGWFNDPAAWKRFLNDPDNAALRVTPGRV